MTSHSSEGMDWDDGHLTSVQLFSVGDSVMVVLNFASAPPTRSNWNAAIVVEDRGTSFRFGYKADAVQPPQQYVWDAPTIERAAGSYVKVDPVWEGNELTLTYPRTVLNGVLHDASITAWLEAGSRTLSGPLLVTLTA